MTDKRIQVGTLRTRHTLRPVYEVSPLFHGVPEAMTAQRQLAIEQNQQLHALFVTLGDLVANPTPALKFINVKNVLSIDNVIRVHDVEVVFANELDIQGNQAVAELHFTAECAVLA